MILPFTEAILSLELDLLFGGRKKHGIQLDFRFRRFHPDVPSLEGFTEDDAHLLALMEQRCKELIAAICPPAAAAQGLD